MSFATRVTAALAGVAMAATLLAGCGQATVETNIASNQVKPFPVVLDNCGTKVTITEPPKRVVSIKSTSTELLLALGLGDRIVGQAFADGPVPDEWAKEAKTIDNLSDKAPSQAVVLASSPDFVMAGWESNLSADTAGERDSLAKLGVNSYVSPAACKERKYQPKKLTFDHVFAQVEEVGRIFGATNEADELIAEQKKQLAGVQKAKAGTTALWFSSGSDLPFVGAGIGAPQMVLDELGMENLAADVEDTWTSMSWEKIAAANPDVIVLVDATWSSAQKKIDYLLGHPVSAELDAVKNGNFVTVPFPASEAGVRTAAATVELGSQLADLGLTR